MQADAKEGTWADRIEAVNTSCLLQNPPECCTKIQKRLIIPRRSQRKSAWREERQKHTGSGHHLPAERKVGNFPQTCRSILFSWKERSKRGTSEVGYKKIKYIDITQQLISLETSKPSANRHATTDRKSSNWKAGFQQMPGCISNKHPLAPCQAPTTSQVRPDWNANKRLLIHTHELSWQKTADRPSLPFCSFDITPLLSHVAILLQATG